MRDLKIKLTSSKNALNIESRTKCKSFGYQILGFGSGGGGAPSGPTQKGLFAFGDSGSKVNMSNLVSSSGVVASDTTGVGTARALLAGTTYGTDKGIMAYGYTSGPTSMSNLINNLGVVATDVTGVGTDCYDRAAAPYGGSAAGTALFAFGEYSGGRFTDRNLISSVGVIASNISGAGTAFTRIEACGYGLDKAIFAFGWSPGAYGDGTGISHLVSNTGVLGGDVAAVGTARFQAAACSYGEDLGIFGYGSNTALGNNALTNKVSNSGVVASDTAGVGTGRQSPAACSYGGDKGIFGFGYDGSNTGVTNLVSNTGVVATDVSAVGTARHGPAAVGFSLTA